MGNKAAKKRSEEELKEELNEKQVAEIERKKELEIMNEENEEELKFMMQSFAEECTFKESILRDTAKWWLWEDSYYIDEWTLCKHQYGDRFYNDHSRLQYLGDIARIMNKEYSVERESMFELLNKYSPFFDYLCNIIIDFIIPKYKLLTNTVSTGHPIKFNEFNKDWDIVPNILCNTDNNHQVLLHKIDDNHIDNTWIDGILLICGGAIISHKLCNPSYVAPLCLDMKFKLFSVDDEILIDFAAHQPRCHYNAHYQPTTISTQFRNEKNPWCICRIKPDENKISINDNIVNDTHRIKEICHNKGEHHVLIKHQWNIMTMQYIDDINKEILYKVECPIIDDWNSSKYNRISIQNGCKNTSFMLIKQLKMYCEPSN